MTDVEIVHQSRKSLAMRVTPKGIQVLVPRGMDPGDPRVRAFIQEGLAKLGRPEPVPAEELLTPDQIRQRVDRWSEEIGVDIKRVQIRTMTHKWASCSTQGILTLSDDLARLPDDLADYVIVHELAHLRIPDHNKGFQALMMSYLPDWRERERRLAGHSFGVVGDRGSKS